MPLSPEERRHRAAEYARRKRREAAGHIEPQGPRLTANPSRASHVRDYQTGRTFGPQTEVFRKCLRLFTPRS